MWVRNSNSDKLVVVSVFCMLLGCSGVDSAVAPPSRGASQRFASDAGAVSRVDPERRAIDADDVESELDSGVNKQPGTQESGAGSEAGNPACAPAFDRAIEVYAHASRVLYRVDPYSAVLTAVGEFTGCPGQMCDIALDKLGNMVGTICLGAQTLARIDKRTGVCTPIVPAKTAKPLPFLNSLSFIPGGINGDDATKETLAGYIGTDEDPNLTDTYIKIDPTTSDYTVVGKLNPNPTGRVLRSSGDLVSLSNGQTFLTVVDYKPRDGADVSDAVVEIDARTGQIKRLIGQTGFSRAYGVGYWGGVGYGFTQTGEMFWINLTTGVGTEMRIPNAPKALEFMGAGSTTSAPPCR